MRLTKNEKVLLVILLILALTAGYYFYVFLPNEEKMADLEVEISNQDLLKHGMLMKIQSQSVTEKRIEDLEENIIVLADKYYGTLAQEDAFVLAYEFAEGLDLEFERLNFNTYASEYGLNHKVEMNFQGSYNDLLKYLSRIQNHDKKVAIKSVDISQNEEEQISGLCSIEFNTFELISNYVPYQGDLLSKEYSNKDYTQGPFVPYEGFEIVEETPVVDIIIPEPDPIDYETYRPKSLVYDFEDGSSYFVGNEPEIKGSISRNRTKIRGGYSEEINFDFVNARAHSEANLIFDNNPIFVNKQAESILLWVYAYEASNHNIGLGIIDAAGKEYKVSLTEGVDFTQWQEVEADLPVAMSYPIMINRIYVEGIGYDQKLTGRYLFDTLQVAYPID